jgi:zinc transport system substrate-binding protein
LECDDSLLGNELSTLDTEYSAGLAQCQQHEIVTSQAAFGYLADRYHLRQIPITGLSPEVEPTPSHLAAAAEEARRVGATTVFFETLVSPKIAVGDDQQSGGWTVGRACRRLRRPR